MGITLELAAHDEDTLENLDDDSTDEQIASALFNESEHTCTAGRIWHVIHYVLTGDEEGTDAPESFILSGGRDVGPGGPYGAARVFDAAETQKIADALIDAETFQKRLSKGVPKEVTYAKHIKRGAVEPDHVEIYVDLKAFIEGAAERDEGLLMSIVG